MIVVAVTVQPVDQVLVVVEDVGFFRIGSQNPMHPQNMNNYNTMQHSPIINNSHHTTNNNEKIGTTHSIVPNSPPPPLDTTFTTALPPHLNTIQWRGQYPEFSPIGM
jgi:hypothetical protein